MNFHILTLFPEMVMGGLQTSITGRAIEAGQITIEAVNIRDFSTNKHKKVDDYPYGGGAGMLMQAQPVYDAYRNVEERIPREHKKRVIYVTPQGYPFTQKMAEDFAKNDDLIFLCGHYEGIDERVLEEVVTDYVSIGDYVLTGGELAAMVMIDAISRLVPGVLHNGISAETESFHGELLEHPQYSRPEEWHGKKVPQVLLGGNQKKVEAWKIEASVARTKERRPDLYEKYMVLQECRLALLKQKLLHMDMIELIHRGRAVLIAREAEQILLKDKDTGVFYYAGNSTELLQNLPEHIKHSITGIVLHNYGLKENVRQLLGLQEERICYLSVYTQHEKLSVSGLYRADGQPTQEGLVIRTLTMEHYSEVKNSDGWKSHPKAAEYNGDYVRRRIERGEMFGAFVNEVLAGFIGMEEDGSIGMLYVSEEYRGRRLAKALQTYAMNKGLEAGEVPYAKIEAQNMVTVQLQKSLGLHLSKTPIVWLW